MSVRKERKLVIESGSPLRNHSLNQWKMRKSLEGERRLGITKRKERPSITNELEALSKQEPIIEYFLTLVNKLEGSGQTVPVRLGNLTLEISSIINHDLKTDPEGFIAEFLQAEKIKPFFSSPFEHLFPVNKMVTNYITKERGVAKDTLKIRQAYQSAQAFARNLGGVVFNHGPEATVISTLVALNNLSIHFSEEIESGALSIPQARTQVVAFGQAAANELFNT